MIHLKVIPTDEQYEGGTDKVAYCTGSDLVWFNPRNNPKLHITVNDSTDTTLLELTATRSSDVTGDIVWTSNLSSDIVQIECSNLGNNILFDPIVRKKRLWTLFSFLISRMNMSYMEFGLCENDADYLSSP